MAIKEEFFFGKINKIKIFTVKRKTIHLRKGIRKTTQTIFFSLMT